jgi:hypothetical protein
LSRSEVVRIPADASDGLLAALNSEAGGFEPGALVEVRVRHRTDCPKLVTGGGCACEPEMVIAITRAQAP